MKSRDRPGFFFRAHRNIKNKPAYFHDGAETARMMKGCLCFGWGTSEAGRWKCPLAFPAFPHPLWVMPRSNLHGRVHGVPRMYRRRLSRYRASQQIEMSEWDRDIPPFSITIDDEKCGKSGNRIFSLRREKRHGRYFSSPPTDPLTYRRRQNGRPRYPLSRSNHATAHSRHSRAPHCLGGIRWHAGEIRNPGRGRTN